MDQHVKFCNMDLSGENLVNMGIGLYNKVPDHLKN